MPVRDERLRKALDSDDIDDCEVWLRVGGPGYRTERPRREQRQLLQRLRGFDRARETWIDGVRRPGALDVAAPVVRTVGMQPLPRVPLLIEDHDRIARELKGMGTPSRVSTTRRSTTTRVPSSPTPRRCPTAPAGGPVTFCRSIHSTPTSSSAR